MGKTIDEPDMMADPSEANRIEWEEFAKGEMEFLGVLEEAERWLSKVEIPGFWKYGKYAYAYHEAPVWLMKATDKLKRFFYA